MTNEDHAGLLNTALAGSSVVAVGVDTEGDLVIEFSDYILRLEQGQKFELMTKDAIAGIEMPDEALVN